MIIARLRLGPTRHVLIIPERRNGLAPPQAELDEAGCSSGEDRRRQQRGDSVFDETCLRTLFMTARSGRYRVLGGTPGSLIY
jgi:hypothetical protein